MSEEDSRGRKSPAAKKTLVERLGQITAILIAVGAFLAAIPPITQGVKDIYCGLATCDASQNKDKASSIVGILPDEPPNSITNTDCERGQFWYNPGNGWVKLGKNQTVKRGTIISHFFQDARVDEQGFRLDLTHSSAAPIDAEEAVKSEKKLKGWSAQRWPDGSLIQCNWKRTISGYRMDFLLNVPPGKYVLMGRLGSEFTTGFAVLTVQ